MPFTLKFLADGQLAAAEAALYTVPAVTSTILKKLILANVTAGAITINIYVRNGAGASREISDKNYSIPANESRIIDVDNVILETGDSIRGDASGAASVDYTLFGVEET